MKLSSVRSLSAATFVLVAVIGTGSLMGASPAACAAPLVPAVNDLTPEADSAIASQNWAQALTQLDARIKTNPRDAQAKFKRATVLERMGRDGDAIAAFTELTQLYPELPEPYNNLAALYAKEGRYEDARAALETAVKASPSYGLAYENLGDLYLRMANAAYQRATALGHASAATRQRMADLQKIVTPPAPPPHARRATQTTPASNYRSRLHDWAVETPPSVATQGDGSSGIQPPQYNVVTPPPTY